MVEEVSHLTTKHLVKITPNRYFQGSIEMVNGSPELFFTISKSLRSHIFNHADNVQSIGPMGGWEMDERGWKFVDSRIVTGSRLLGGTLGTGVWVPAPLLVLGQFSNSHPFPKPLSQSAEVGALVVVSRGPSSSKGLSPHNQAPISALESAPQNQPPATLQQRPPTKPCSGESTSKTVIALKYKKLSFLRSGVLFS